MFSLPYFSIFDNGYYLHTLVLYSIYKKDVSTYFQSLTGYLVIGIFLLLSGLLLWVFPDTNIFDHGYATLESFFRIAPYLLMFLIPATTMHSIAGERSEGTYDLLLTKPLTIFQLVAGKYFASLTVIGISILPTLMYWISVYQLGQPVGNVDNGAIIGSYIGLFLLAATFTAISIWMSSLTTKPVIAFLLAISACFVAYYVFDALAAMPVFDRYEHLISRIGVHAHYDAISRGVLDSRDLIYFVLAIALFLGATVASLRYLHHRNRKKAGMVVLPLFLVVILANFLSGLYFGRIDFTEEKRYTLAPVSKQTATDLPGDVHVTIFLTGELPSGFNRLRQAATDLLADLRSYSGGRLRYSFVDPLAGNEQQRLENTEILAEYGIQPTNLSVRTATGMTQQLIFPGALVSTEEADVAVNLLQNRLGESHELVLNNSIENLEYTFVSALRRLATGGKALIGFTEGNGETDNMHLYDALQSLLSGYQVGRVNLSEMEFDGLDDMDVLVINKPTQQFSEIEKFKIDYFVMKGGRVVWAIDQMTADIDSMRTNGYQLALPRNLNLDDMLFTYGIRFNYNLLGDLNCTQIPLSVGQMGGQAQIELAPWLFYPILMPMASHPLIRNLDGIRTEFIGTIDTIATAGVHKEFVLHSSPYSRTLDAPADISLQMVEEIPDPETFKSQPLPVAALLEGTFSSVFAHRPVPEGISEAVRIPEKSQPTKMLAIADGDIFANAVNTTDGSPYPLGWDRYTQQQFANKSFLLNTIDYLTDDEGTIALRDKEVKLRLLDPIKTREDKQFWQLLNVALPPLLLLIAGLLQQYFRRQRYGRPQR